MSSSFFPCILPTGRGSLSFSEMPPCWVLRNVHRQPTALPCWLLSGDCDWANRFWVYLFSPVFLMHERNLSARSPFWQWLLVANRHKECHSFQDGHTRGGKVWGCSSMMELRLSLLTFIVPIETTEQMGFNECLLNKTHRHKLRSVL